MAGRGRRNRRGGAKAEVVDAAAAKASFSEASPPPLGSPSSPLLASAYSSTETSSSSYCSPLSSGSSSDRTTPRKIPLSLVEKEEGKKKKTDPRTRTRDPRGRRPLLLAQIRGHYIDAISRLPTDELRATLAYGLLVGGHCYGPLHPVHNIIVNSVWFAAAFPFRRGDPIEPNFFNSQSISRLAHRSIDGLLASLRHHCPALSDDDALWHLYHSGACLRGAVASARGAAPLSRTDFSVAEAAAEVARHPKAAAFALFATSVLPAVERDVHTLLVSKRTLSSPDIVRLSAMLLPFPLPDNPPQPSPRENTQLIMEIIAEKINIYRSWYQANIDIANAALSKFAGRTGAHYHLHAVYANGDVWDSHCHTRQYYHINFMAWPEVDDLASPAAQAPVRFFAEARDPPSTNCSEENITLCCMLVSAQTSPSHFDGCYGCMSINQKVDHPDTEDYFRGHPYKMNETQNVSHCPSMIDVDFRFFDPDRDNDLVEYYAELVVYRQAIYSEMRLEHARSKAAAPRHRRTSQFYDCSDSDTSDDGIITFEEDILDYCIDDDEF